MTGSHHNANQLAPLFLLACELACLPVCFSAHFLFSGHFQEVNECRCLTIEAETVLDGGMGGRRRRRERQGEGLQGGPHYTHKERPRLGPGYVI